MSHNYSIQINGSQYGLISRYAIPAWLTNEYCTMPFVLNIGQEKIFVDSTSKCFLCNRLFSEATKKCPLLFPDIEVNRKIGFVQRCCSDCYFWVKSKEGYTSIPISIKKVLDEGYWPVNAGKYYQM